MTSRSYRSRKTLEETEVATEVDTDIQCAETAGVEGAAIRSVERANEFNIENESYVISGGKKEIMFRLRKYKWGEE
jgi:hypothetical protein